MRMKHYFFVRRHCTNVPYEVNEVFFKFCGLLKISELYLKMLSNFLGNKSYKVLSLFFKFIFPKSTQSLVEIPNLV